MSTHRCDSIAPPSAAQAILRAAEHLFSDKGFDAASVNEIARKARVSKANVFHHFGCKRDLYLAVLRSACEESSSALFRDVAHTQTDYPERLRSFAHGHLQALLAHQSASWLMLRAVIEEPTADGSALAERVFGDNFERLVTLIREGQHNGFIRCDLDPAALVVLLIGADVFFFQTREVLRHLPAVGFADDPKRFSSTWWDVFWTGVAAQPQVSVQE